MFKRVFVVFVAFLALVLLISVLSGIKGLQIKRMVAYGYGFVPLPAVVTTATVEEDSWETFLDLWRPYKELPSLLNLLER